MSFGWLSKKQVSELGYVLCKSIDGHTVQVSEITDMHHKPTAFDDYTYVGEVVDFIGHFHSINDFEDTLTDSDIIESKELIVVDANQKNAKTDWVGFFSRTVNVRDLFGRGILIDDKHPRYFGAN